MKAGWSYAKANKVNIVNLKNWSLHVFNFYAVCIMILHWAKKLSPENRWASSKYQLVSGKDFSIHFKVHICPLSTFQKLSKMLTNVRRGYWYRIDFRALCVWPDNTHTTMNWQAIIFQVVWCLQKRSFEKPLITPAASNNQAHYQNKIKNINS